MPGSQRPFLTACLDANVVISAIAFGGIPLKILFRLFQNDFKHVTSPELIEEMRRNLVDKLGMREDPTYQLLNDILAVSSVHLPVVNWTFCPISPTTRCWNWP